MDEASYFERDIGERSKMEKALPAQREFFTVMKREDSHELVSKTPLRWSNKE